MDEVRAYSVLGIMLGVKSYEKAMCVEKFKK